MGTVARLCYYNRRMLCFSQGHRLDDFPLVDGFPAHIHELKGIW